MNDDEAFKTERIIWAMQFIQNRLDNVALEVVEWMPEEDNEQHHNAVEMLQSAYVHAQHVVEAVCELIAIEPDRYKKDPRDVLSSDLTELGAHDYSHLQRK